MLPPMTLPADAPALLYIEDNPINVLIVEELVQRRGGIRLHCADDMHSGLACAKALKPRLILLDMHLPDGDGFETLRLLRSDPETVELPCIALSANAMPEDVRRARLEGFADYWTKPIDFQAFLAGLERYFPAQR